MIRYIIYHKNDIKNLLYYLVGLIIFGIQITNLPLGEERREMSRGQQTICSHNSITENLLRIDCVATDGLNPISDEEIRTYAHQLLISDYGQQTI